MNYRIITYTLGWVLNIEALCLGLPLLCSLFFQDGCASTFLISILLCLFVGTFLCFRAPKNKEMFAKEGFITVALSWLLISIFGAIPFYISDFIPEYYNAFFETVSGFTTTGASILTDVEILPESLLMWRSFTHWIGGMGVLVFVVAILPLSGGQNFHLIKAESPGPSVNKLVPKVKSTAKILYTIYLGLTFLQFILLLIGKMDWFEALNITFGTAGTGGFAVRNSGLADYSPYCQNIITIFMLIFGVDFSIYYLIILRKFKGAIRSDELRTYVCIVLVAILLISINCKDLYVSVFDNIRTSALQVASIITTTGYASTDFDLWPEFSKTILIILMFIGGCAGSTAGGIKVSRIVILMKTIAKEIKISAHPKSTHKVTMNNRMVEHQTVRATNVFIVSYMVIFMTSLLLISLDNFDFITNFTAVTTTISNVGPGLADVGPTRNFALYSPLSKIILSFNMLVGRLEIFPMLILFSPFTWKK